MSSWIIVAIFILVYIFISVQRFPFVKIDRPAGVLTGVTLLVLAGGVSLEESYFFVDWNVITFLLGMMIMVAYLQSSGFFKSAASFMIKKCPTPKSLLAGVIFSSALLSALFVNDTVCLLMAPTLVASCRSLKISSVPYLAALALSSNIGGAMTITGNPQNMYIGIKSGVSFAVFTGITAVPSILSLLFVYFVVVLVYKGRMKSFAVERSAESEERLDKALMAKSLAALGLSMVLFICGAGYPLAALIGATVIILTARIKPSSAFRNVDWPILLFFAGLFIVMGAVEKTGILEKFAGIAGASPDIRGFGEILGFAAVTALLSNAVSNVPAVVLMVPFAGDISSPLWATLLGMISTFAGNLTLIGSVANLIVSEKAEASGASFTFLEHLKTGVPVTVFSCFAAVMWIYFLSAFINV